MKRIHWLSLLAPLVLAFGLAQAAVPPAIALTHITVIDMTGAPPRPDMTVVIRGDRIDAVGASRRTKPPPGARVIDARHEYLIPGLWDMHTHNFFRADPLWSLYIANGVTGIRDMGGEIKYFDVMEKERREGLPLNGRWPAPRVVAAGVILDGRPPIHPTNLVVTDPKEARQAVDMLKGRGADFIKVYNMLTRPAYFAIANEASKDGLPFVGHVPFAISAAEASDAGQKSIEHSDGLLLALSSREPELRAELLDQVRKRGNDPRIYTIFKLYDQLNVEAMDSRSGTKAAALFGRFVKNGTWVVPTLVVQRSILLDQKSPGVAELSERYVPHLAHGFWMGFDTAMKADTPQDLATKRKVYSGYVALISAMQRAGVQLLAGTDTTNPWLVPGFSLHEELDLLVAAGLTPLEALQTATINPARFLGRERDLGTVERGKLADLVLLEANPLANIHNATRIAAVIADGRYLSKQQLQQMLAEVAASAAGSH